MTFSVKSNLGNVTLVNLSTCLFTVNLPPYVYIYIDVDMDIVINLDIDLCIEKYLAVQ